MKFRETALYFFLSLLCNSYATDNVDSKVNSIIAELSESKVGTERFTNLTKELADEMLDIIASGQIPDFDKNLLYNLLPRLIDNVESDKHAYIVLTTVQHKGLSRDKSLWEKWYFETPRNEIGWIENSTSK